MILFQTDGRKELSEQCANLGERQIMSWPTLECR